MSADRYFCTYESADCIETVNHHSGEKCSIVYIAITLKAVNLVSLCANDYQIAIFTGKPQKRIRFYEKNEAISVFTLIRIYLR